MVSRDEGVGDSVAAGEPAGRRWLVANAVGMAVCFGTLGNYSELGLAALPLTILALAGGLLGLLQWLTYPTEARRSPAWIIAALVGWMIGLPLTSAALSMAPRSIDQVEALGSLVASLQSGSGQLMFGFFTTIIFFCFFGALTGIIMGIPYWIILTLSPTMRATARAWYGRMVLGWSAGVPIGGIVMLLIVTAITVGPTGSFELPRWFVYGGIGALAGIFVGWFTQSVAR